MSYTISNPTSLKVIGQIHFGGLDYRWLVELDEWDREFGATHRWVSDKFQESKYPYIKVGENSYQQNPFFRTGLLKLKEGTKLTFFTVDHEEKWGSDPWYAKGMKMKDELGRWAPDTLLDLPPTIQKHISN